VLVRKVWFAGFPSRVFGAVLTLFKIVTDRG